MPRKTEPSVSMLYKQYPNAVQRVDSITVNLGANLYSLAKQWPGVCVVDCRTAAAWHHDHRASAGLLHHRRLFDQQDAHVSVPRFSSISSRANPRRLLPFLAPLPLLMTSRILSPLVLPRRTLIWYVRPL